MTATVGEAAKTAPPSGSGKPRPGTQFSWRLGRLDMKITPYIFVAPFFILFGVFGVYPLVYTAYLSTHKWTLTGGDKGSVGFKNYQDVLQDDQFWTAIGNTFGMFIIGTIPQLLLALLVATWLNKRLRARTTIRMGVLLPNVTSVAAVGIVFGLIFAERYGMANWLLQTIGLDGVEWRQHRWSSWTAIATMVNWRWTGYNALIYLAAMQAISKDLYESASLDGAGPTRRFFQITLPMLQPTIVFTVIISTIGGMQLFTEPLLFGYGDPNGGSLNEFQTIAMYIYQTVFTRNTNVGYGAAMSWLLFLMIVLFALGNFLITRRSLRGSTQ